MRRVWLLSFVLGLSSVACSSRASDSGGDDATTGVDGGDDAAESGSGDPELEQLCTTGCERFLECAPSEYATAYADDQACFDYCFNTFSANATCREAAGPYAQCTAALECANWPDLLADPATSLCADEWAVAGPACGLI